MSECTCYIPSASTIHSMCVLVSSDVKFLNISGCNKNRCPKFICVLIGECCRSMHVQSTLTYMYMYMCTWYAE